MYLLNDFLNARPIPKVSHFDIATLLKTTHFQSDHFQAEATRPKIKIFNTERSLGVKMTLGIVLDCFRNAVGTERGCFFGSTCLIRKRLAGGRPCSSRAVGKMLKFLRK